MNAAHWHLILNHLPVVGIPIATCLGAAAFWKRSDVLMRAALWMLAALPLGSVAVYLTGLSAQLVVMDLPDVPMELIEAHEKAATVAFAGLLITGLAAEATLLFSRRKPEVPRAFAAILLAMGLALSVLLGWVSELGGNIRHTEIRPPGAVGEKARSVEKEH